MTKYTRIKNGECSFQITEEFDSAEKAANPSNDGSNAEVKIENIKLDFTTVKRSMMEDIKMRLQKLKDLQEKKHKKYLEAKYKANKYQKDSYELFWKIEQTKEELMTA